MRSAVASASHRLASSSRRDAAVLRSSPAPHSGAVMEVGFVGRDGRRLWSASRDGTAVGIDFAGGDSVVRRQPMRATPHTGTGAAKSPLVAAIRFIDGAFPAILLDSDTGRPLGGDLPMTGLEDCLCQVASVALAPDGRTALGGVEIFEQRDQEFVPRQDRGHVVLWDTERRSVRSVVDLPWPVYGIDVSADGSTAVVQGRTGYALIDVDAGTVRNRHDDLAPMTWYDGTQTVEVSPDGRLAALARDTEVVLVDARTGEVVRRRELAGEEIAVLSLAWARDGQTLSQLVREAVGTYLAATAGGDEEPFELLTCGEPGGYAPTPAEMAAALEEEDQRLVPGGAHVRS